MVKSKGQVMQNSSQIQELFSNHALVEMIANFA